MSHKHQAERHRTGEKHADLADQQLGLFYCVLIRCCQSSLISCQMSVGRQCRAKKGKGLQSDIQVAVGL